MSSSKPRKPGTFKPGQSGNPKGRAKIPPDILEARQMSRHELERILNRYIFMTKAEIIKAAQDPNTPALELMIASLISKGTNEGDYRRISFLLDRLGFVVTQKVEVMGEGGGPIAFSALSEAELDERIRRLTEKL